MTASVTPLKDYELMRLEAAAKQAREAMQKAVGEYTRAKYALSMYLSLKRK